MFMFDYEKLYKEMYQYTLMILQLFNKQYGSYFSLKMQNKMFNLLKGDNVSSLFIEEFHSICSKHFSFLKDEKIEIQSKLGKDLILYFVDLSIQRKDNLENQTISDVLRKGFSSWIAFEFSKRNQLHWQISEDKDSFIHYLKKKFSAFDSLLLSVFANNYLKFAEIFFEQTGEDLEEVYRDYLLNQSEEFNLVF